MFAPGQQCSKYYKSRKLTKILPPGGLNQNELSFRIDHYVTADSTTEHLHNQLIASIYGNVGRDPPDPGVASWVSTNDKPTVLSKPVSGDAAEQRLKTEVMQLPARDRRRIKEVPEVSITTFHSLCGIEQHGNLRLRKLADCVIL